MENINLQYPIGKYEPVGFSVKQKEAWLTDLRYLPQLLENAVSGLDEFQLATPYRDGGWQVKQVVHHVADSHINAYTRFRLGLTEADPTIRPYDQEGWAELPDVFEVPINVSLTLLHALHIRWHHLLTGLTDEQWQRCIFHPEHQRLLSLWYMLGMYAWHGKHHVAQITILRKRMNW